MSNLEFDEENEFHVKSRRILGEPETPGSVRFLLNKNIVKSEKQALIVLIVIIVICFGTAWWLLKGDGDADKYLVTPDGFRYTVEEYTELVEQGLDPLNITP